jgi:hypothetical protein
VRKREWYKPYSADQVYNATQNLNKTRQLSEPVQTGFYFPSRDGDMMRKTDAQKTSRIKEKIGKISFQGMQKCATIKNMWPIKKDNDSFLSLSFSPVSCSIKLTWS